MNEITSPLLTPDMRGAAVADLQDALRLLLDRGAILRGDEGARRDVSTALERERGTQIYGGATRKLVSLFQETHRLEVSGEVDERTAATLKNVLTELGAFDPPTGVKPDLRHLQSILRSLGYLQTQSIAGRLAGAMSAKGWDRCYSRSTPLLLPNAKLRCSFDRSFNNSLTITAAWVRARGQFNPNGTRGPPFADRSSPNCRSSRNSPFTKSCNPKQKRPPT